MTFTPAGKVSTGQLGSVIKSSNDAGMRIELYYQPDPAKVTASEIAFIQIVRRLKPDGSPDRANEQAYAADRTTPAAGTSTRTTRTSTASTDTRASTRGR